MATPQPSDHSYLPGAHIDLICPPPDELLSAESTESSVADLDSSDLLLLPLLPQPVVLFPHEKLPMRLAATDPLSPYFHSRIKSIHESSSSRAFLGTIFAQHIWPQHNRESLVGRTGTVASLTSQVINPNPPSLNDDAHDSLVATVLGVRRFRVVKILDSTDTISPRFDATMQVERRIFPAVWWTIVRLLPEHVPSHVPSPLPLTPYSLSTTTGIPLFLLQKHDVRTIIAQLRDRCDHTLTDNQFSLLFRDRCPLEGCDPLLFSHWIAANLPLAASARQKLLDCATIYMRLQMVLELMGVEREKKLSCRRCGAAICAENDVFSVPGAAGVNAAYVNPHGAVHQTVTLRKVVSENVQLENSRSTLEDTWFPGYAWTICYCRCGGHLGWKFAWAGAAEEGKVSEFFGVTGTALMHGECPVEIDGTAEALDNLTDADFELYITWAQNRAREEEESEESEPEEGEPLDLDVD